MKDMVNHPEHYISDSGIEVIDVIEEFTSDLKGIEVTDTGNIIKYICRWKHKNELEDLKKAQWYLNHLIKKVEGDMPPKSPCNNAFKHGEHMPIKEGNKLKFLFDNKKDATEFYFKVFEFLIENDYITEREAYKMYGLTEWNCGDCSSYNHVMLHRFIDTEETDVCLILTR